MAANHMEQGIDVTTGVRVVECIVVTPEETALQTPAQFIALPLFDGEIGIAPGRAPLIGRLGHGEMRIREGTKTLRYYVDGGFVEVNGDVVSVLTNRAVKAEVLIFMPHHPIGSCGLISGVIGKIRKVSANVDRISRAIGNGCLDSSCDPLFRCIFAR
jgi:hypothetical protein